jgi:two-component system chemotaxis response regulator CheB
VIAEDSALMTSVLSTALSRAGIEVGRDGVGVLRELRARDLDIPVVVVSAFSRTSGARAVDALAEGAFELVAKPSTRGEFEGFVKTLAERVVLAGRSRGRLARKASLGAPDKDGPDVVAPRTAQRVVLIACSTGGPRALAQLMPKLPASLGNGTLIVQHMPAGFTTALAARLDRVSKLTITEAHAKDHLVGTKALLAPGGHHMRIEKGGVIALSDAPPVGGLRPRADITICDAATEWGSQLVLVVLTGMGRDGLVGARAVKAAGGRILVEAESSCVVYGMPRAIAEAGLADEELDLSALARAIVAAAGQ